MATKPDKMPAEQSEGGVHLHKTKNNQNAKGVAVALLQARLADAIDMSLITKAGTLEPERPAIHRRPPDARQVPRGAGRVCPTTMAERIVQLGGTAFGTVQEIDRRSALAPYPVDIYQVSDHMHALIDRYAAVANAIRQSIDEVDEAGDPDTADIFTEVSRGVDKQLWFLEAHTQEQSPSASFTTDR